METINVNVKDFQIIKSAKAEFIPGLNLIIGPSNNGKTSFIKAIKSLLYTEPGTTPIRSGQPFYSVGMTLNGHTVILQKGLKESSYIVDGKKYSKYGTSTPEEVSNALGIKELVLNGNKEQLNFWNQMEYPFLLDKSSTDLFRFIVDSGENDKVSLALKDMVKDRQQIEKNITQIQGNILMLDEQIKDLTSKTSNSTQILSTCKSIIDLKPRVERLHQLEESLQKITSLQQKSTQLQNELTTSNHNVEVVSASLKIILEILDKYNKLETLYNNINTLTLKHSELTSSKLLNIQQINTLEINNNLTKYLEYYNYMIKLTNISNTLNSLSSYNIPQAELVNLDKFKTLYDSLNKVNQNMITINNLNNQITSLQEDYKAIDDVMHSIEICPLCGNKMHVGGN